MTTKKIERRIKIKYRVRNKISGTPECPRMSVFRSNKQIYVQVIDDLSGKTLAAASSLGMEVENKADQAKKVGALIALIVTAICIMVELKRLLMQPVTVVLNSNDYGN